jgi:hypothetical protein
MDFSDKKFESMSKKMLELLKDPLVKEVELKWKAIGSWVWPELKITKVEKQSELFICTVCGGKTEKPGRTVLPCKC